MEMRRTGASNVFLDVRHLGTEFVRHRFPRIYETCLHYGLDMGTSMAPVHPAAHYAMGGIRTDLIGRTNVPRLFAAGEVASTGVHGANRLASNSLLEGVVFGARAGAAMREWAGSSLLSAPPSAEPRFPCVEAEQLRALAWEKCGIVRSGPELEEAAELLAKVPLSTTANPNRALFELRSTHVVIEIIAACAAARKESRGAHYRTDYPEKSKEFQKHSLVTKDHDVVSFQ
jgi:L-aspartate oxidase